VGGGIAGSILAGVLARSGVQVLVAEKEPRFRDRIRGESTYPWGVAEAARLGATAVFDQVGAVELVGTRFYEAREPVQADRWAATSLDGLNEAGFPHPRLQEAAFCWAESMGAAVRRPMKVTGFSGSGVATVTVSCNDGVEQVQARLVVGADGKMATSRRWTGGQSAADPEHHRFGGVAVSGVRTDDRDTDNLAGIPGLGVNWFAQGAETTRLYLNMAYEQLRASRADRSFEALIAVAAEYMPDGALDGVRQEGPIGFFSNADTWATQIAGNGVVLIGDAAGSVDPTQGLGTSLLFRDVRELSDLLLSDDDWPAVIREYAERRRRYFAVLRQYDLWRNIIDMDASEAADRLREGNKAAAQADPTLGGFALIEARGPDGLVADASARAAYFGKTLAPTRSVDQSLSLTRRTVFGISGTALHQTRPTGRPGSPWCPSCQREGLSMTEPVTALETRGVESYIRKAFAGECRSHRRATFHRRGDARLLLPFSSRRTRPSGAPPRCGYASPSGRAPAPGKDPEAVLGRSGGPVRAGPLLPSAHIHQLRLIISPRTLLCWHAGLVRRLWAYPRRAYRSARGVALRGEAGEQGTGLAFSERLSSLIKEEPGVWPDQVRRVGLARGDALVDGAIDRLVLDRLAMR
jgi:2-polyprenyl-6-methoxyphenol hydroxylase-like FAD-dependent oxidoreductase